MRLDLLHLTRHLRRSPASAIAAILTLALTLGAGAAIFAIVDAVLLTPPPFTDPGALAIVGETPIDQLAAVPRTVSYATFEAWRERARALAVFDAFDGTNFTLTGLGASERITATTVTPGLLTLLGVSPALGRLFDSGDVGRPVVVISHAFWRRKLAADPDVIGHQIILGGQPHGIVGVLPQRFFFALDPCDVWRPFPMPPAQAARDGVRVRVLARLASGTSPFLLADALQDVSRTSSPPSRAVATPVAAVIAGDATNTLVLLGGAAALATAIAFANLAGLLIVRSIDRWRELAVRTALGARRSEIVRQLLLEASALVVVGSAGGVLLALWLTPIAAQLVLQQFRGIANVDVTLSWRVVGLLTILALICAGICGSLPALIAARATVVDVLRRGTTPQPRELRWRRLLVTGEVAVAFVLVVCVALLGGSLIRILSVNPGFDVRGVLVLALSVPAANYSTPQRVASFYAALQNALEDRLGPRTVSMVNEIPLSGTGGRSLVGARPESMGPEALLRETGPAYFEVMRIPIAAGRSFDRRDDASAPPRVVVSESLTKALFASGESIGRHIWLASLARDVEIIGVVAEVQQRALDAAASPTVYLSAQQSPSRNNIIVVRSSRPDADVIAVVREEVAKLDGDVPVYGTRSMQEVISASPGVPARRVLTATFLGFALLAVVLGAIGLFGVVAHDVARRRAELALRLALGADPMRLLSATLWQGAVMVGSGLAVGGVLSFWAARALGSMLFATNRFDILSVSLAAMVLAAAGIGAALPAALRAARTDPLIALRAE
jgi:predicted permease